MAKIKCVCSNPECHKEFYVWESTIKKGGGKYCCKACHNAMRKTNRYILHESYAELIIESKKYGNQHVLIDIEDVERCKLKSWSISYDKKMNDFYFYAFIRCEHKKRYSVSLHRYIMGEPKGLVVDHINTKDRLDNRKSNLRVVTQKVNCRNLNELKSRNGTQGVSFDKMHQKWKAYIGVNKKKIGLGTFENFQDAVKVRKDAELRYWGRNKEKDTLDSETVQNPYLPIRNITGFVGIKKRGDNFTACLNVNYRRINLGTFATVEEAVKARDKYIDDNNLRNRKNLYGDKIK